MTQQPDEIDRLRLRLESLVLGANAGGDAELLAGEALEELAVAVEELQAHNAELEEGRDSLERERIKYRSLFEAVPAAFLVSDMHGMITEANSHAYEMLAPRRGVLKGKPLITFVDLADRTTMYGLMNALIDAEEGSSRLTNCQMGVGASFPAGVNTTVGFAGDGQAELRWLIRDRTVELATDALTEHEHQLRSMLQAASVGVCLLKLDGEVVYANAEVERLYGARFEPGYDDLIRSRIGSGQLTTLEAAFTSVVETTESTTGRYSLNHPSGEVFWVDLSMNAVLGQKGMVQAIVATLEDVTAEVEEAGNAELAIAHLSTVLDGVNDAVISFDERSMSIVLANRAAEAYFAQAAPAMIGRSVLELFPTLELTAVAIDRASEPVFVPDSQVETIAHRPDGSHFPTEVTLSHTPVADGQLATVIVRDITTRIEHLAQLREGEAFVRSVLDSVGALILVVDGAGIIEVFNKACEKLTGLDANDVVGELVFDALIPAVHVEEFRAGLDDLRSGRLPHFEYPWTNTEGEARLISWNTRTLHGSDGNLQAIIATGIDVTERRRLEEQLRQSQMLESIGRLAGGVAHDFNNLLAIANLRINRLRSRLTQSQLHSDCDDITAALERGTRLVSDLMSFSRQQRLDPIALNIPVELEAMRELMDDLVGNDVVVSLDLADEPTYAFVDPNHFDQILLNLTSNAADAMPDGGSLTISSAVEHLAKDRAHQNRESDALTPGDYVKLEVTDTGMGMSPDVRARVFEPFFTTKPTSAGTGLGMAITQGIVAQSGGAIEIESVPSVSTTIHIWLPWVVAPVRIAAAHAPRTESDHGGSRARRFDSGDRPQPRVLLVEDDVDLRRTISDELRGMGCVVSEAGDKATALRSDPGDLDLLISDIGLASERGTDLAREMTSPHPGLPVLLITGYPPTQVEPELGDLPVLYKPFSADELRAAVRERLDVARSLP